MESARAAFSSPAAGEPARVVERLPAPEPLAELCAASEPLSEFYAASEPLGEFYAASDGKGWKRCCGFEWDLDAVARGYFLQDQRIEWSGVEGTFGVEGVLAPSIRCQHGAWETTVEGEFYLNQPFDRNILVDTAERASYQGNWEVDTFEISQLRIMTRRGDFSFGIGKMATPFGRTYFPLMTNAWLDAPFIRTESILWRETGLLMRYEPGWLVADVALTNGGPDRDANSSKALVSRVGIEGPQWAAGLSVKVQDGIGSETQKTYNNHFGADVMLRRGPWRISGEVIHDEYGFRRPGFDPNEITWGRSIYYRDQNFRWHEPITGLGYYVDVGYEGRQWSCWLNYGEFYPQKLGHPQHDRPNRRGIAKVLYAMTPNVQMYTVVMTETEGYVAQDGRDRIGLVLLAGFQWEL